MGCQVWLDCAALVGKRLTDVKSALRSAWQEAASSAPSVLVLDRLHLLVPKPMEGPHAGSPADTQASILADLLDDLMTQQALMAQEAHDTAADCCQWLCTCGIYVCCCCYCCCRRLAKAATSRCVHCMTFHRYPV